MTPSVPTPEDLLVLSYHSLLGTQIVQCTPTPEDHLALSFLLFTPGIPACSLPRHRPVHCWFLLSRCLGLGIFSRCLHCRFRLPRTFISYHSSGPCGIRHAAAHSHVASCRFSRLPRTLWFVRFTWLDSHGLLLLFG
jgi:hypothetical protein